MDEDPDDDESLPCLHLRRADRDAFGLCLAMCGTLGYFVGWPILAYLVRVVPVILGW